MFDSSEQLSVMYAMHRGYVYFVHGESPMKESTATLYRAKIGDTSDTAPEAIYTFSGIGATIFGLSAYGNNLFLWRQIMRMKRATAIKQHCIIWISIRWKQTRFRKENFHIRQMREKYITEKTKNNRVL